MEGGLFGQERERERDHHTCGNVSCVNIFCVNGPFFFACVVSFRVNVVISNCKGKAWGRVDRSRV